MSGARTSFFQSIRDKISNPLSTSAALTSTAIGAAQSSPLGLPNVIARKDSQPEEERDYLTQDVVGDIFFVLVRDNGATAKVDAARSVTTTLGQSVLANLLCTGLLIIS
jgi:hypothetical protein